MRMRWMMAALLAGAVPHTAATGQAAPAAPATTGTLSFADLDRSVRAGDHKRITSVVVLRGGKLVHEAYFKGDAETRRNTRSLTKTVTALLVGAAIDRGAIKSVHDPVLKWFSDVRPLDNPDPRKGRITIEDFLTMSSLLECNDENSFSRGNEERMYLVEDWIGFTFGLPIRGAAPWETPAAKQPYGRSWSYCTAGVSTLGAMLERATRKPLPQFADEVLHRLLGIAAAEWQFAPKGFAQAGGGTAYRTRDIASIAEVIRNGGQWNGKQVVARAFIDAMTTPKVNISDERGNYGYLTWLPSVSVGQQRHKAMAMFGTGGNRAVIVPDLEMVVVVTAENFGNREAHPISERLVEQLILAASRSQVVTPALAAAHPRAKARRWTASGSRAASASKGRSRSVGPRMPR